MLPYLYWPLAIVLMGWGQGWLINAVRRTPPGSEARKQALALHYVLVAYYYLALVFAPAAWLVAVGARLLLFDLSLNVASGAAPFHVGDTALADKLLQRLGRGLGWPAERVRFVLWLIMLLAALAWLFLE